ncbi:MAG: hypothetical protein JWL59_3656 [Chthoniobacteraceae bacterium]|nr:hypothetical protein [Chthoniobacteraceae bacterium]
MTAVLLSAQPIFAQENAAPPATPAVPADQRLDLIPTDAPRLPAESLPLIPDAPARTPKPKKSAPSPPSILDPANGSGKKTKTEIADDELRGRIRFREAKTKAIKDPLIQSELGRAQAARTDFVKREAMKSYYKLLYARMTKIDASIKPRIDAALTQSLHRLEQDRLKPSEGLDPQERRERDERE